MKNKISLTTELTYIAKSGEVRVQYNEPTRTLIIQPETFGKEHFKDLVYCVETILHKIYREDHEKS